MPRVMMLLMGHLVNMDLDRLEDSKAVSKVGRFLFGSECFTTQGVI